MDVNIVYESRHTNTRGRANEVITMYVQGYSATELANTYKVNVSVIKEIITRNKIELRSKKEARSTNRYNFKRSKTVSKTFDQGQIDDMIKEYREGKGINFLSKKYNVDACVIIRVLGENNISVRSKKEQYKYKNVTNQLFRETIISRYGGWKELIKRYQTNFKEKYGVINPMQKVEFFEKQQKSAQKIKTFIVEEKEFKVQGYEEKAIKVLLAKGYTVDDLETGKGKIPTFIYTINGKEHRYYPDIYISKENRIIEVKSRYTFEIDMETNLAKKKCVEELGFKFDFIIF